MKTIDLVQGSPEWHAHRNAKDVFNASEAPAMLGKDCNGNNRTKLLRVKATGINDEIDPFTQKRFDDGHAAEALARPLAESFIQEGLSPTTGIEVVDGVKLSASFDGINMMGDICFEHKALNDKIRAALTDTDDASSLPACYRIQMEQQLAVSGADKCLFMATKWNLDSGELLEKVEAWYYPDLNLRSQIIDGWKQFAIDLAEYKHVETVAAPVAAPVESLPAVMVQVSGSITIADNFKVFEVALRDFLDNKFIRKPETDQDFVDLDTQIKALKRAEDALDGAEGQMLAQAEPIAAAKRTKDMLKELVRSNRLMAEKLLKDEKVNRKAAIITEARAEIEKYVIGLNQRIGGNWMPLTSAQPFVDATHGLKSIDSMKSKVSDTIASEKLRLVEIANTIEANRKSLTSDVIHLFPDFSQVCQKSREDFAATLAQRIAIEEQRKQAARAAEEARTAAAVAAAVEAERMAEAKRAAEAQANDQRGKTGDTTHAQQHAAEAPQVTPASTPPITAAEKSIVIIEHQDEISQFMKLHEFGKNHNLIRAALVEFVAFQASLR